MAAHQAPLSLDSPGKNTGVGCHFLPQCMKVKSESEVAQSGLTLSDPMDYRLPGSSIHGVFQARELEWLPLPSPYDPTDVGNLISYSSAFPNSSLYIWKFSVLVLLKPNLEDFEHYLARHVKWVQLYSTLSILWHCLSLELEWKHLFQSHGH